MLPCGSGVRQGPVFGLETCFVPDFRCHSVLEKDISLRYSDFSWSCSDITNTPVLLLWNSPSVHNFANSIFCMKSTMHMQTTSGPRSAGLTSLLRHDWSGMHSRPHPFFPSTTGRRPAGCVCLSVLECVNALLRLPEFICLVSSGATPFYSFHAKVSPRRPLLLSCLLFCLSLSVRFRLFGQKDEQKQSLSHRKSAAWAQGACRHIVELDAASHAEFICFTDVARMHTQSELPCSLSQWWCICSHGVCIC